MRTGVLQRIPYRVPALSCPYVFMFTPQAEVNGREMPPTMAHFARSPHTPRNSRFVSSSPTFVATGSPMLSSSSLMHASRAFLADILLSLGCAGKGKRKRSLCGAVWRGVNQRSTCGGEFELNAEPGSEVRNPNPARSQPPSRQQPRASKRCRPASSVQASACAAKLRAAAVTCRLSHYATYSLFQAGSIIE